MAKPWEGFWQVTSDNAAEDIVPFRNTTIAVRKSIGFVILTRSRFMEIGAVAKRQGPAGWPPTKEEAITMLRSFHACAGHCDWKEEHDTCAANQVITMASDSRLEGTIIHSKLKIDGEICLRQKVAPGVEETAQTWRRLSGAGSSPLAGAWETGESNERWMYLVTAGHYGIMRVESGRPKIPSTGKEFNDDDLYALWEGFGANAGARLETKGTFDHWPMIAQVAGYEVRKHETFRIDSVEEDKFIMSFPPADGPSTVWHRID